MRIAHFPEGKAGWDQANIGGNVLHKKTELGNPEDDDKAWAIKYDDIRSFKLKALRKYKDEQDGETVESIKGKRDVEEFPDIQTLKVALDDLDELDGELAIDVYIEVNEDPSLKSYIDKIDHYLQRED